MKLKRRTTWTREECDRLVVLARAGKTGPEIAKELHRTPQAVWCRLYKLRKGRGGAFMPRQSMLQRLDTSRMDPLVKRVLLRAITEGFNYKRLARRSGVSAAQISNWAHQNPQLPNFVAVANAVGYKVVLVHDDKREAA